MPGVFAAVFHPPTLDNLFTTNADQRLARMKVAIQQAHGVLTSYAGRMGVRNPFFIFTAPEYYFVKDCTGDKRNFRWTLHTEAEKKQILEELRTLSGRYDRFLIAPGTIAWCRPRKAASGIRTHDGWNTAPILYGGKLKHEYDKIFDDGCFRQFTQNVLFQKGTKSQLFTIESLKFGIEICGDFEDGNLSKEARPESLDFELMLSATNPHGFDEDSIAKVPIRNGGYFIHSDSDKSRLCGAWCVQRGSGSHGLSIPARLQNGSLFDPWTGRRVDGERLGISLSAGTVLVIKSTVPDKKGVFQQQNHLRLSGGVPAPAQGRPRTGSLPPPAAFAQPASAQAGFHFRMQVDPVAPFLNDTNGRYTVEATAVLQKDSGHESLPNQMIKFHALNGTVLNPTKWTNSQGEAKAVFTGDRNHQPLQISATFQGATLTFEAKIDFLGSGNVSKIARLQPETVIDLWSYYLPI